MRESVPEGARPSASDCHWLRARTPGLRPGFTPPAALVSQGGGARPMRCSEERIEGSGFRWWG